MFFVGVAVLAALQSVWGNGGLDTNEVAGMDRLGVESQKENPPGILLRKDDGMCEARKPMDMSPGEVQTETKTVVKEIVVEIEEPREGIQEVLPVVQYEGQAKVSAGNDLLKPSCGVSSGFTSSAERCYVLTKDAHDGDTSKMISLVESLSGRVKRQYTKNITGVSFCSSHSDVLRKVDDAGMHVEEDKIYTVSMLQNNIPNYMYLMRHYENTIFNNYFYDNWIFRVLQIKRVMTKFLGSYEYYHTGKGVNIFLLDTAISSMDGACNLSGRLEACNAHGNVMAELLVGKTNGFAKDSRLSVLDVVDCDGKVALSEMIHGLEGLRESGGPSILVFGVSGPYSAPLNSAVDRISSRGTVVVSPAGNSHDQSCNYSPGSSKSVINVGSVDKHAGISRFSNHGDCIRMFAPGEDVLQDSSLTGTSLSAAIVASSIALFLETSPRAAFPQIWGYLNQNSFWNSRGSYSVLKIPRLGCKGRIRGSIFRLGGLYEDIVPLVFVVLITSALLYLLLIGIRRFRRRREQELHDEDVLFDPPVDRF
ncbi:subtilase-like protein [Encephalitozoon cuniculi]|nr:subtilase-like protein [Encephalitozoon cuniculi]